MEPPRGRTHPGSPDSAAPTASCSAMKAIVSPEIDDRNGMPDRATPTIRRDEHHHWQRTLTGRRHPEPTAAKGDRRGPSVHATSSRRAPRLEGPGAARSGATRSGSMGYPPQTATASVPGPRKQIGPGRRAAKEWARRPAVPDRGGPWNGPLTGTTAASVGCCRNVTVTPMATWRPAASAIQAPGRPKCRRGVLVPRVSDRNSCWVVGIGKKDAPREGSARRPDVTC